MLAQVVEFQDGHALGVIGGGLADFDASFDPCVPLFSGYPIG